MTTQAKFPLSRRELLNRAACGFGSLALTALCAEPGEADGVLNPLAPRVPHFAPRARRIIFLWMQGGPSHVDLFENKPRLRKQSGDALAIRFAPELSLTLLDGHSLQRRYALPDRDLLENERFLSSRGAWEGASRLALVNDANGFRVDLAIDGRGAPTSIWRFPLETVSNSEGGFERTYQGSVIVPLVDITLDEALVHVTAELAVSDVA